MFSQSRGLRTCLKSLQQSSSEKLRKPAIAKLSNLPLPPGFSEKDIPSIKSDEPSPFSNLSKTPLPNSQSDEPIPEQLANANEGRKLSFFERLEQKIQKDLNIMKNVDKLSKDDPAMKKSFLYRVEDRIKDESVKLELSNLAKDKKRSKFGESLKKKMDHYFDSDRNLKERDALIKTAFKHGYFDESKEIAKKGDKLWIAPKTAIPMHMCHQMLDIDCINLLEQKVNLPTLCKGKVSLVTFVFSAFGEPHVKTFVDPFLKDFAENKKVQLIQINVEETWTKVPIVKLCRPLLRRKIPGEQHATYLNHYENISEIRRSVGISNKTLGWVHIVDERGFIRWQAHGKASEDEVKNMKKIFDGLLQPLSSKRK